jgi:hypothetical protein
VYFKQSGLIVRQRLQELPEECSEPSLMGEYQDFEINESLGDYFEEPLKTKDQSKII